MKCENCQITMTLDRTESSDSACAQWMKCPLCSRTRMVSHLKDDAMTQPNLVIGAAGIADTQDHEQARHFASRDSASAGAGAQHAGDPEFFMDSLLAE